MQTNHSCSRPRLGSGGIARNGTDPLWLRRNSEAKGEVIPLLDDRIRQIASTKINALFKRRGDELHKPIAEITSDSMKIGILHSSVNFQRIEAVCVREMRDRVGEAWPVFCDFLGPIRGRSPTLVPASTFWTKR